MLLRNCRADLLGREIGSRHSFLLRRPGHAVVARTEQPTVFVLESPEGLAQLFEQFAMLYPVYKPAFR